VNRETLDVPHHPLTTHHSTLGLLPDLVGDHHRAHIGRRGDIDGEQKKSNVLGSMEEDNARGGKGTRF